MYNVVLAVEHLTDSAGNNVHVYTRMEMPFVPSVGMTIAFDGDNILLTRVIWEASSGTLFLYGDPVYERYHFGYPSQVVKRLEHKGWTVEDADDDVFPPDDLPTVP